MPDRTDEVDPGLATRLTDYVSTFPTAPPPEPGVDPRAPRRRWLAALATGAAAASAGAVIGLVLLAGPRSDVADASATPTPERTPSASREPSITPSPTIRTTPSAVPTTTATATPTPTPAPPTPAEWTAGRVVPASLDPSTSAIFRGVVWHPGPGFIAHGLRGNEPASPPGIWTSPDGMVWQPAAIHGNLAGYAVNDIAWTTSGPPRFVAVADRFDPSPGSAVLVSTDGTTWVEAATPTSATYVTSVTYGASGFVAVGYEPDLDDFSADGRVWHSPDGLTWTEAVPASLDGTLLHGVEFVRGRYVAAGFPDREAPPLTAWVSADGRDWNASVIMPSSGVGCTCLATGSNGSVMIVGGTTDVTFLADSADGAAWNTATLDRSGLGATTDDAEVLGDGTALATGSFDLADGPRGTLIWVRDAGTSAWRSVSWRDHLPDVDPSEVDLGFAVYLAVAQDRTVILVADGTVIVTSDRVP